MQTEKENMHPFLSRRCNGKAYRAGFSVYGLCAAWNHATNPSLPMTDAQHRRSRQYARAIIARMRRIGYREGVHYSEWNNGSFWVTGSQQKAAEAQHPLNRLPTFDQEAA